MADLLQLLPYQATCAILDTSTYDGVSYQHADTSRGLPLKLVATDPIFGAELQQGLEIACQLAGFYLVSGEVGNQQSSFKLQAVQGLEGAPPELWVKLTLEIGATNKYNGISRQASLQHKAAEGTHSNSLRMGLGFRSVAVSSIELKTDTRCPLPVHVATYQPSTKPAGSSKPLYNPRVLFINAGTAEVHSKWLAGGVPSRSVTRGRNYHIRKGGTLLMATLEPVASEKLPYLLRKVANVAPEVAPPAACQADTSG